MGLFETLFGWTPEKNKWYSFYDRALTLNNVPKYSFLRGDEDRLKIKPFAYLNGKKYRARFYLTKDKCKISLGKNKKQVIVPLKKCSFKKSFKQYFRGQSRVDEYSISVLVKD
ncbi:MAG: hypothetical protein WC494_03900 [Candidatus Pacearchaeota archaeon]